MKLSDHYGKANKKTVKIQLIGEDFESNGCWIESLDKSSVEFKLAKREFDAAHFDQSTIDVSSDKPPQRRSDLFTLVGGELESTTEYHKLKARLYSSIITGWCFDDEFSREAVFQWLYSNPNVAISIDIGLDKLQKDLDSKKNN